MAEKRRTLYIFSFKVILFIAFLLGIIYLISDYVPIKRSDKIDNSLYHLSRTQDSIDYDIFCFSNSYIYTSIDPLFLEYLTGLNSLQFCSNAQRTFFTLETIEYILEYYQPKCIIIDLSKSSASMPQERLFWSMNINGILSSNISPAELFELIKLAPDSEKKNIFFDGYSDYTAVLYNLYRWKEYKYRPRFSQMQGYLSFLPLTMQKEDFKAMSGEKFDSTYYIPGLSRNQLFDDISREKFFEFFNEFSKTGIKVIFISTIKLNSSLEGGFDSIAEKITEISPDNYFTINLNDTAVKRKLNLTKEDFSDSGHLTHSGASKVTEYLAPMISVIIQKDSSRDSIEPGEISFMNGLEISDYNLIIEDYYQKTIQLYITNPVEEYEDSTLVLSVFPKGTFLNKLSEESIKKSLKCDDTYISRKHLSRTNGGITVATVYLNTKLKKEQIDKIEISSHKSVSDYVDRRILYEQEHTSQEY